MIGHVFTIEEKCTACNKCIAVCPVDGANQAYRSLDGTRKIVVSSRYCISCGSCLAICDHGARDYHDDTDRFFRDLAAGETIHVVAAPAAQTHFPDLFRLFGWLESLGAAKIYDVSLGADISTWAYLKAREALSLPSAIAQPCPAIVNYCELYMPELLPFLAPVQSPLICLAIYLRQVEKLRGKIAFLSPCIAKSDEISDPNTGNQVAYNVTFSKLKKKMEEYGIDLSRYPEREFDGMPSGIGHVYSRPGGLSETVRVTNKSLWLRQVDTVESAYPYLQEYLERRQNGLPVPDLVDILNCRGGCNLGTGTDRSTALDDIDWLTNARKQKKEAEQLVETSAGTIYQVQDCFDRTLRWEDFRREYTNRKLEDGRFCDEDLDKVFQKLRKNTPEARNINCYACGYGSCKRFAQALKLGMNLEDSCIDYERSELMHDTLTPLLNHAGLEEALEYFLWLLHTGKQEDLSVIMMDVDDFKLVNDTYGHDVGDEALKAVAEAIRRHTRPADASGRWGGDEFMILLPRTDMDAAREIARRICNSIQESDVLPCNAHFTSSAGIACAEEDDTPLTVFQRVDQALYESKKERKSRRARASSH